MNMGASKVTNITNIIYNFNLAPNAASSAQGGNQMVPMPSESGIEGESKGDLKMKVPALGKDSAGRSRIDSGSESESHQAS